jgi:uncharacterized membrane protein (DUF373 family)
MVDWKRYKWPIISIVIIMGVLAIMILIGFELGILSTDPDGLERVLEDWGTQTGSEFWTPLLSFIQNEGIAAIIGIVLSVVIIGGAFYLIIRFKNKKKES